MQFGVPVQPEPGDPKQIEAAKKAIHKAARGAWDKDQDAKPAKTERELFADMMEAATKAAGDKPVLGLNIEYEVRSLLVGTSGGIRTLDVEDDTASSGSPF